MTDRIKCELRLLTDSSSNITERKLLFNTASIYLAYRVVADFPNKSWFARGGFKISKYGPRGNITVIEGSFATKADGRRVSADFIPTRMAVSW